jgi:integrase
MGFTTASVRIASTRAMPDEEERARALTEDELRRLLDEVPERWRLLVELLAHTGLRIGEAVALQWGDIDLGQRRLRVRRRIYRGSMAAPKSAYGRREVPLSPGLAQSLWQARKDARAGRDGDPVFASQTGGYLDPGNLFGRVLKPSARRAGVPWAGFHTLRHTCAERKWVKVKNRAYWRYPLERDAAVRMRGSLSD